MTEADNPSRTMSNANLRSIILMVAAMGCFTLVDLLIKIASQTLPVGQVMMTLGAGSTAVFAVLIMARARRSGSRPCASLRCCCEMPATLLPASP